MGRKKKPHDNGDPWDVADVEKLLDMYNRKYPAAYIASQLGRTISAVRSKLYRLFLSS